MQIHANDTLETESAQGTFVVPPKLTVAVMLDGDLDAVLDGQPLGMTAHDGPNGYLWINRREARLERWLRAGQRARKVTVSVTLPVAASSSDTPPSAVQALMACVASDRTLRHWQPSAQAVRHAEDILAAATDHEPLDRLELARLALLERGATVGEAAYSAGYTNAANFSTAFSRAFGYPPSACLKG